MTALDSKFGEGFGEGSGIGGGIVEGKDKVTPPY